MAPAGPALLAGIAGPPATRRGDTRAAVRYRHRRMHTRGRASFGSGGECDAWRVELADPLEVREAWSLDEVADLVAWVDAQAHLGRWGVLLLAYESAPAFDAALQARVADVAMPLAWAATYDAAGAADVAPVATAGPPGFVPWEPACSEAQFAADIARILEHIRAGDTYQVNYTFPLQAPFRDDPWRWFRACARQAMVPFAACVDLGDSVVMSLSPELFFDRRGDRLRARPMKGTIRRGRWLDEDRRLSEALTVSEKARAENVMIVDLLRNDIGRVAVTGSVRTSDLCALERYPTVWQLTSTIEATLRPATTLWELLQAVFPCGSITGAPKVRTMEIIAALESSPRGVYTGALCLLHPGGDVTASVPIRTAVLQRGSGLATFSVGAGITADSDAGEEWAECLAKARVVRPPAVPEDAALFETMRLDEGVLVRREAHLQRLLDSAALFGWQVSRADLQRALDALAAAHVTGVWRARMVVDRAGAVRTEAVAFAPEGRRWRLALAAAPVDSRNPLLFNKTTRREIYEDARAGRAEVDDVLLWNGRGEVTEGTVANVVVELDGVKVTPPVACGLLPGVFRNELLTRGDVRERVVRVDELPGASRVWLVNSLREWIDVDLVPS